MKYILMTLIAINLISCTTPEPLSFTATVEKPVAVSTNLITAVAVPSKCSNYSWKNRGLAPKGYIKGMALAYAKTLCEKDFNYTKIIGKAKTGKDAYDALSWYNSNFNALGMKNDKEGLNTIRHSFALLIGLGMRESSGKYCTGRDASATNIRSQSAEAGLFQTSYDSRGTDPELPLMYSRFKKDGKSCFLEVFKEGASCKSSDLKNWGTGEGVVYQKLNKECPVFAAQYAAIMLRTLGGTKGHYGPLRTKAAEIKLECNDMLLSVQKVLEANPNLCNSL